MSRPSHQGWVGRAVRCQSAELVEKANLADNAFEIMDFELAPATEKEKTPEPTEV